MDDNKPDAKEVTVPAAPSRWAANQGESVGLPTPDEFKYMVGVASELVGSALFTPDMYVFQGPPQLRAEMTDKQVMKANAMAKMLAGHELGIPAIESLRTISVVKGKTFVAYEKLLAIMLQKGYTLEWLQSDMDGARLNVKHPKGLLGPKGYTAEFNVEKAKRAGLWTQDNYSKRPDVMFRARAASDAYRVCGAGPTLYSFEEQAEIEGLKADEQRATVLEARADEEFKVGRRAKHHPTPALAPVEQISPALDNSTTEEAAIEVVEENKYGIHIEMDGKLHPLGNEPSYKLKTAAYTRAQELANGAFLPHVVIDLPTGQNLARFEPKVGKQKEPTGRSVVEAMIPRKGTQQWADEEMAALVKLIGTGLTGRRGIYAFIRGYLGTNEIPPDPELFVKPLALIRAMVTGDKRRADYQLFMSKPAEAGARAAGRMQPHPLEPYIETAKWPQSLLEPAKKLYDRLRCTDVRLFDNFVKETGLAALAPNYDNMEAFMRLTAQLGYVNTLMDVASKFHVTYQAILEMITQEAEKPIEELSQERIEAWINTAMAEATGPNSTEVPGLLFND